MNRVSASAVPPLLLLVAAAAVESLRVPAMVLLLLGFLATVLRRRASSEAGSADALGYAGCLVVALNLAWDGVPLAAFATGIGTCVDRMGPFAGLRLVGAVLVLTCVGVLLWVVRADRRDLGIRWPSRGWLILSVVAAGAVAAVAIVIGPRLAEPFFGPVSPPTAELRGLIPAIGFAVANASMEEVAYRGALLRWLAPATRSANALALQALVFGLAHGTGTDFVGSPLPVMAATAAAGLVLGGLALRSRSLLLPFAIHLALDVPVFYGKVCLGG